VILTRLILFGNEEDLIFDSPPLWFFVRISIVSYPSRILHAVRRGAFLPSVFH